MRNADKYKTAEARADAYNKYCYRKECSECELNKFNKKYRVDCCMAFWLELEAEENLMPCPFCGKYTYTVDYDFLGYWGVKCSADGCWYHSHLCKTESEAIAVHNRVAKAAIDAKKNEVK